MRKTYFVDVNRIDTKLYYLEDKKAKQASFKYKNDKLLSIYNSCIYSFESDSLEITPNENIYAPMHYSYFSKELFVCGTKFGFLDRIGKYAEFVVGLIDDNNYDIIFLFSDYIMAGNKYGTGITDRTISMKSVLEKMNKYLRSSMKKVTLLNAFISNFIRYFTLINMTSYGKDYILLDDTKFLTVPYEKEIKRLEYKKRNTHRDVYYINKMVSDSELINLTEKEAAKIYGYVYNLCSDEKKDFIYFPLRDYNYKINCKSINEKILKGEENFTNYLKTVNKSNPITIYHSISHNRILDYTKKAIEKHFKEYRLQKFDEEFLVYFLKYTMLLNDYSKNEDDKMKVNEMFKKVPIKLFTDQKNTYLYLGMFNDVNIETYKEMKEISFPL